MDWSIYFLSEKKLGGESIQWILDFLFSMGVEIGTIKPADYHVIAYLAYHGTNDFAFSLEVDGNRDNTRILYFS